MAETNKAEMNLELVCMMKGDDRAGGAGRQIHLTTNQQAVVEKVGLII